MKKRLCLVLPLAALLLWGCRKEEGPDHSKSFLTQVLVDDVPLATGEGTSKKSAQQMAAYKAILLLKENE